MCPYGTLRTGDIEDSDVEDKTLRTGDVEDRATLRTGDVEDKHYFFKNVWVLSSTSVLNVACPQSRTFTNIIIT